jgi:short-subunit dehydrogenase
MHDTQTILIPGASGGTGHHLALHVARAGYRVIGTARNLAVLQSVQDEARACRCTPWRSTVQLDPRLAQDRLWGLCPV